VKSKPVKQKPKIVVKLRSCYRGV